MYGCLCQCLMPMISPETLFTESLCKYRSLRKQPKFCKDTAGFPDAYLPTPRVQKPGDILKSLHWMNVIFDNVWIISKNHLKAFWMFLTSRTACKNRANFLPCIVQSDWLISDQLRRSLVKYIVYQLDCSVLSFPIEVHKIHFLFYFPLWHLENNEIQGIILRKAMVGISQEIWCSNQETRRSDEKLGESRENWENWQVCWHLRNKHRNSKLWQCLSLLI